MGAKLSRDGTALGALIRGYADFEPKARYTREMAYSYRTAGVAGLPVSAQELDGLKASLRFDEEDRRYLRLAGEVLDAQSKQVVDHWRSGINASIPNLARRSRTPDGDPCPEDMGSSNLRFQRWIADTCLRPYDRDWIDYQREIALRRSGAKKNELDRVRSPPCAPLPEVIAFIATMKMAMKPYLAAEGHSTEDVEKMHQAWCKSMQLQLALWISPYPDVEQPPRGRQAANLRAG